MLSLATLDMLLSISEGELIEEMVVGLLAAPQLAIFFEKFPRIKRALMKDIPAGNKICNNGSVKLAFRQGWRMNFPYINRVCWRIAHSFMRICPISWLSYKIYIPRLQRRLKH